jgi:hypothetical protein
MPQRPSSTAEPGAALRFEMLDARIRLAVEAAAAVDPNPSDSLRGLYVSDDMARSLAQRPALAAVDPKLERAAELLGLTPLDAAVLGLCAAPELSPHYARLFGYLHDDVARKLATPRLVVRLLAEWEVTPQTVWSRLTAGGPLRSSGAISLLDAHTATPIADRPMKVGDPLVSYLLGARLDDPSGGGRLSLVVPPLHDLGRPAVVDELRNLIAGETTLPLIVCGPDALELVAVAAGRALVVADLADADDRSLVGEASLRAVLDLGLLCFTCAGGAEPSDTRRRLRALLAGGSRVLICCESRSDAAALTEGSSFVVEAPLPGYGERRAAWASLAGTDQVDDVAAKFRLPVGRIAEAAQVARAAAGLEGRPSPSPADLDRGARHASASGLSELAVALDAPFAWDDLVLPQRQQELLRSISSFLRHRDLVLSEWGYERTVARSQGLNVLFAGESGTGKTMAAQVLARELGLDIYRIDLAATVSKYIGETEKNLDRIFAAAEGSNAILFFDEADALFGRRSEVRDSHDRYANIEVAYLLQRMDSYPGAVVLATNFRQNMDDAFLRRLDFVIDFPFPEADDRRRIWRLVLPEQAPVDDDLDLDFLANQFRLSGGNIRNASLAAAFAAAEDGTAIGMRHLIQAVALEYTKLGRLTLESEFERFHDVIRAPGRSSSEASTEQP